MINVLHLACQDRVQRDANVVRLSGDPVRPGEVILGERTVGNRQGFGAAICASLGNVSSVEVAAAQADTTTVDDLSVAWCETMNGSHGGDSESAVAVGENESQG